MRAYLNYKRDVHIRIQETDQDSAQIDFLIIFLILLIFIVFLYGSSFYFIFRFSLFFVNLYYSFFIFIYFLLFFFLDVFAINCYFFH